MSRFPSVLAQSFARLATLFVAELVRLQAVLTTHLKSHDFSYGAG